MWWRLTLFVGSMSWWCAAQGVTTLSQERAQYEASSESGLAAIKVARIFEEDRENCYVEVVSTGEIIPAVDVAFPSYNGDRASYNSQDVAVVRLQHASKLGGFIPIADVWPNVGRRGDTIKIVSNYTSNNLFDDDDTPTVTTCQIKGFYELSSGVVPRSSGTDCDTGPGSSGSSAFLATDTRWKFIGLVSAEFSKIPGTDFDPRKQSTVVTLFDYRVLDA